jgi:hypothetical protein
MSDTGAPWNLPYPLPTDLVRDGADAIKDLAEAVADGLDAAGNPGIGSNVVQTVKTDSFTTTSTSLTAITGLAATITPSSATAKVLILVQINIAHSNVSGTTMSSLFRLTGGNTSAYESTVRATERAFGGIGTDDVDNATRGLRTVVGMYLDSPATASAVTYGVNVKTTNSSNTIYINRGTDLATSRPVGVSSITVIEVAP